LKPPRKTYAPHSPVTKTYGFNRSLFLIFEMNDKGIKQMETPGQWGSWTHETPKDAATSDVQPDMYGLYPAEWRRSTARENSEANQHRTREMGGGLGFAGYEEEYRAVAPARPLSVAVAAVESEVRLG
jgi:hypothetical protein